MMDITNNKEPERKFDSRKHKLYTIEYIPSFFEKLKYSLKRFDIFLVTKPPPKLKNIICAKIDPISFEYYSGVYEIPFIDQTDQRITILVGLAGKFKYRKTEHIADIYNRKNTALARFYQEETI